MHDIRSNRKFVFVEPVFNRTAGLSWYETVHNRVGLFEIIGNGILLFLFEHVAERFVPSSVKVIDE